jgi:hypothetical protein
MLMVHVGVKNEGIREPVTNNSIQTAFSHEIEVRKKPMKLRCERNHRKIYLSPFYLKILRQLAYSSPLYAS